MIKKEQSDPIIDKLNTLIKITMATAFKDKTKEERILILLDLGIQRKEAADIVRTTVPYVDQVKHKAKKKQKKSRTKKERKSKAKDKKGGKKSGES